MEDKLIFRTQLHIVPNPNPAYECEPPCTHGTQLNLKFFTKVVEIGCTPTDSGFTTLNFPSPGALPVFLQSLLKGPGGGCWSSLSLVLTVSFVS